ncbi:putative RNA helicase-like splicing factor [Taphrina deformans PYCC 5710]|uniref:RNA helicase n=1 Tax=Taphrina deformans (strain PYCC 5710 / ATCC 11124 / CBS 356.35 / IMI 108563 / JCM 9778 / NBRC 8474) TaxID=1097556 RepID=R4XD58_TAPDE|nr:putative RNA helicase-like splicing factor [Taphrina deformans PYCC 5710]|eukprot:CCG81255.1 putative RNA helicase-like splicing factor [Taphrina deformans PYCC 5710]
MEDLEQLEKLNLVSKVTQELANHVGIHEKILAEYIINQHEESADFKDFKSRIGGDFPDAFVETIDRFILTMHPKHLRKLPSSTKASDGAVHNEPDTKARIFKGLCLPDQVIKYEDEPHTEDSRDIGDALNQLEALAENKSMAQRRKRRRSSSLSRSSDSCTQFSNGLNKRPSSLSPTRSSDCEDNRRARRTKRLSPHARTFKSEHSARLRAPVDTSPVLFHIYTGRISNLKDFGAFVSLDNMNRDGLVHVSNIQSEGRVNHPADLLGRGQVVWVKVIRLDGSRISLSMKDVDQASGRDLNPNQQLTAELAVDRLNNSRKPVPVVEDDENSNGKYRMSSRKRLTSPERWEIKQLIASGVVPASQYPDIDDEYNMHINGEVESDADEEFDVEIREEEPPFLQGQTRQSLELSPIRVIKAPDGSMNRAAMSGGQFAKDRREAKEQAMKEQALAESRAASNGQSTGAVPASDVNHIPAHLRIVKTETQFSAPRNALEWREATNPKNAPVGRNTSMSIQQQRESLPVYALRAPFIRAITENQLLIVVGETGSGKTTQLTQYLAEEGFTHNGKIACTQPRRVAAMSVAKRVSEEVGCRLGQEVGYTIRFEDCTSTATKIKYCTDGMLQRECLLDPDLKQYSVIILDEAHERTIATDVLFGLLKKSLQRRPDLKLIVTSATLDSEKFSHYFFDCPIFTIPGRTFPVEVLHTKEPESDYLEAALMAVMQIHLSEPPGDILLFLTGQEEIDTSCEVLYERMKSLGPSVPELLILPIYSSLPSETQARVFEPAPPGSRKVVIATNIAETSITIDGIYYVIDPGFVKQNAYDPKLGMDSLIVTPISQAQARQRSGRAGRTGPGKCYRLYTEAAYRNEMLPNSVPEIQRQNLSLTILMLKAMGINDLIRFDFMDPPPTQTLLTALEQLYTLGALDNEGLLTRMGRKMADFPMEPYLAKVLLASVDMGCSEEILTIIAMLSTGGSVFYRPKDKQKAADEKKKKFNQPEGDHLTLLTVYNAWKSAGYSKSWCQENYINGRGMKRAQDIRNQLEGIMDRYKHQIVSSGRNYNKVRRALISGFFTHAAKKDPQEGYKTVVEGTPVYLHPSSALFGKPTEWVIYHELIATTKEYMHCITAIEPKWLPELAPAFFKTADANKVSKAKARDKIVPLHDRFAEKDDWRISKQRKMDRGGQGNTF